MRQLLARGYRLPGNLKFSSRVVYFILKKKGKRILNLGFNSIGVTRKHTELAEKQTYVSLP